MNENDYYIDREAYEKANKHSLLAKVNNLLNTHSGYMALICALINISLGVFFAVYEWYIIVTWFTFLIIQCLAYLIMELKFYMEYTNVSLNQHELTSQQQQQQQRQSGMYDLNSSRTESTQQLRDIGQTLQTTPKPINKSITFYDYIALSFYYYIIFIIRVSVFNIKRLSSTTATPGKQ